LTPSAAPTLPPIAARGDHRPLGLVRASPPRPWCHDHLALAWIAAPCSVWTRRRRGLAPARWTGGGRQPPVADTPGVPPVAVVDTLARDTSEASADIAGSGQIGGWAVSRRGTSVTSPADMASSAIITTVTDSTASSTVGVTVRRPGNYPPYPSGAPIRTAIPLRPGTNPAYCHWRHRDAVASRCSLSGGSSRSAGDAIEDRKTAPCQSCGPTGMVSLCLRRCRLPDAVPGRNLTQPLPTEPMTSREGLCNGAHRSRRIYPEPEG